ncbi:MAG: germination protein M [Clostridium sp.]|jgi:germination protein M
MKKFISVILCSLLLVTLVACGKTDVPKEDNSKKAAEETKENVTVGGNVQTQEVEKDKVESGEVVLYFSDDQAMYLVGEKRNIEKPTAESIVAELVKGPSTKSEGAAKVYATLPVDLEILDVKVADNIAYVNFKNEVKVEGSAGENMFIFSIVNTLVLNNELGITKVQFLVDGEKVDTMGGQTDVSEPFIENKEMMSE